MNQDNPTKPVKPNITGMNVTDGYAALISYADKLESHIRHLEKVIKERDRSAEFFASNARYGSLP